MTASKKPGITNPPMGFCRIPARTPGALGYLDQGDPNIVAFVGNTPGVLGNHDWADPSYIKTDGSNLVSSLDASRNALLINTGDRLMNQRSKVKFSLAQLSDADLIRLKAVLEKFQDTLLEAPTWKVVQYTHNGNTYLRRAPGSRQLMNRLGAESFQLFGILISLGIQSYEAHTVNDKRPREQIREAFFTLLGSNPVFGAIMLGATLAFPTQTEEFKKNLFDNSAASNGVAELIVKLGGQRFQKWSETPSWIDYF